MNTDMIVSVRGDYISVRGGYVSVQRTQSVFMAPMVSVHGPCGQCSCSSMAVIIIT